MFTSLYNIPPGKSKRIVKTNLRFSAAKTRHPGVGTNDPGGYRRISQPGLVIDTGFTQASNCSAVKYPSATAASLSVVPSLSAFLATEAALS